MNKKSKQKITNKKPKKEIPWKIVEFNIIGTAPLIVFKFRYDYLT